MTDKRANEWWSGIPLWGLILALLAFSASWGGQRMGNAALRDDMAIIKVQNDTLIRNQVELSTQMDYWQTEVRELRDELAVLKIYIDKIRIEDEVRKRMESGDE